MSLQGRVVCGVLCVGAATSLPQRREFYDRIIGGPLSHLIFQSDGDRESGENVSVWRPCVSVCDETWNTFSSSPTHSLSLPLPPPSPSSSIPFQFKLVLCGDSIPVAITHSSLHPSFPLPPSLTHVNWYDILTEDAGEEAAARSLHSLFQWRMSTPLLFGPHKYITALTPSPPSAPLSRKNSEKILGILPRSVLLPSSPPPPSPSPSPSSTPLIFFSCTSESDVADRVDRVREAGGDVIAPSIKADGTVAILKDPFGTPFALYHRTDNPEEEKESTNLDPDYL